MKIFAIVLSVLAGLALIAYLILLNRQTVVRLEQIAAAQAVSFPATETPDEPPEVVRSADGVIAKCKVVPIRYVDLSFNTSGLVEEVLVKEGEVVTEGQILARLSNLAQFQASITAAELEILNAQQELDALYREAPLAAAEALKELADLPVDISSSERQLAGLTSGEVNQADIDIAKANVAFAKKELDDAEAAYKPYENRGEENLTRAALLTKLSEAQKRYDERVAKLNQLQGTASDTRIAQAEADLAYQQVKYEEAQKKFELLKNGPDPDRVALANANLLNAEAQLAAAQAALDNMELKSPFAGTIAQNLLKERQFYAAGSPVIQLVDFSSWQVETTNLTELNVVFLDEGNKAVIVFDSLPDQQFPGTLRRIQSLGENQQGDIVYTAIFSLDQADDRLRWNMTCNADIKFDTGEN